MHQPKAGSRPISVARRTLVGLIVALAAGALLYELLLYTRLKQTAALFIGLPAILAVIIALIARPRSVVGMVMTGMTIALLLSGILLREGFVCILMAAPIFYAVGFIVAKFIEVMTGAGRGSRRTHSLALLPFLLFSLEGVHERLSFPRDEVVIVERVVAASAAEVELSLGQDHTFEREPPLFFRLGFPKPLQSTGAGLQPGDQRRIGFAPGDGEPVDLFMEVEERAPGFVRFRALSDETPIAQWLTWREAEVSWIAIDSSYTQVHWTLRYERRLDPSWYFGPWERYAAGLAADYLIKTVATPPGRR